jgi:hypothetical protein
MGIGGSIHKSSGWKGQWSRTKRWQKRLKITAATCQDEDEFFDHVYAFFQNCYHLRDWLKASGVVSGQKLSDFFSVHREMRLCRDICNGTKHFDLTQPGIDANFSLVREYVPENWPGDKQRGHVIVHEATDKNDPKSRKDFYGFNLIELADKCVNLWSQFLKQNNLE